MASSTPHPHPKKPRKLFIAMAQENGPLSCVLCISSTYDQMHRFVIHLHFYNFTFFKLRATTEQMFFMLVIGLVLSFLFRLEVPRYTLSEFNFLAHKFQSPHAETIQPICHDKTFKCFLNP
jgi:hypothetical protein